MLSYDKVSDTVSTLVSIYYISNTVWEGVHKVLSRIYFHGTQIILRVIQNEPIYVAQLSHIKVTPSD